MELAQRCGPNATVIAADPWAAGMKRLRRKIDHLGLGNVILIESDAVTVELADESIDLVVSNLGINNFENADAVLRACFRVARPDGRLFLTTNLAGHMAEFYDVYRAMIRLASNFWAASRTAWCESKPSTRTLNQTPLSLRSDRTTLA